MLTIRQKKIIRLLEDNSGSASIDEMLNHLYISKSTLRRDLINLEKASMVQRFHGGVGLIESGAMESPISQTQNAKPSQKVLYSPRCKSLST